MKAILHLLITALVTVSAGAETIDDFLFPPDLLVRAQAEVPLTEDQRRQLQEVTDIMETRFPELRKRLEKETEALAAIVKPERVDLAAALAQLGKVFDVENEMKRAHLGFMLAIKHQLTPEQQAKLAAFRKANGLDRASAEELQKRLVAKAARVRLGIEKLVGNGGDPSPVAAIMEEARALMEKARPKEAEAAIDRALKALGEEK